MESSLRAISGRMQTGPSLHCGTAMAQGRPTLNVELRTADGSRATRRLRRSGYVPGVVYGMGEECRSFQANERELSRLLHSGAAVFDVAFDGDAIPVIVKDQQLHP